jgi:hypothetical protein
VTISNLNVSLSAPFSNPSPNYYDLTAYTADLTQNETYDLSIFVGNGANPQTVGVWIDYNQNQKFESSELVYTKSDPANSGTHILNTSITIPSSAKTGSTRMRVGTLYGSKTPDPCNNNDANSSTLNWSQQFLDFSVNLLAPATQSFLSCNAFQNNYDDVVQGSSKNLVIGFQVATNTAGTLSPLTAGDFTMSTLGTTSPSDISNARLYYTGINPNFSSSTQVGSTVAAPNGTFTINAGQKLKAGTNYFWLVFDVSTTALLGNQIDARLNAVKVGSSDRYPITSNPFGYRKVGYCVSRGSQTNFVGVWNVSLNTLSNNTFYTYTNGYVDYTYLSTNLTRGSNYNLTIQVGNGVNPAYARTWIDYNRDGDFDDAGELVSDTFNFSTSQQSASYPNLTKSIAIPSSARVGPTRMRVSTQAMPNKQDPCTNPIQIGEVEDYTVIIQEDGQPVGDFKSSVACLGSQTDFYDNSYTWVHTALTVGRGILAILHQEAIHPTNKIQVTPTRMPVFTMSL